MHPSHDRRSSHFNPLLSQVGQLAATGLHAAAGVVKKTGPNKVRICQIIWQCVKTNSTPVVHIKIAGKWMFIPLKMVLIGIDPYPFQSPHICSNQTKNCIGNLAARLALSLWTMPHSKSCRSTNKYVNTCLPIKEKT